MACAVVVFGEREILAVVVERAQIDVRGGVHGLEFEHLMVGGDGVGLGVGIFFKRDAAREPRRNFILARTGLGTSAQACWSRTFSRDVKVHQELAGDGLQQFALVAERNAVLVVDEAPASSRGFSTPADCLRMASSDWRITAAARSWRTGRELS